MNDKRRKLLGFSSWKSGFWPQNADDLKGQFRGLFFLVLIGVALLLVMRAGGG